jgi:D-arabinose 1-dehydrogenase-like Zn-dependent alcohol dehydrogenase
MFSPEAHWGIWQPAKQPEYLYEALDFVAQGKVKTVVETYPLAEAPKADQRVVEGKA